MMSAAFQPLSSPAPLANRFADGLRPDQVRSHFEVGAHVRGVRGAGAVWGVGADRASLESAAAELVSSAFVQPMLESINDSPLRPQRGPFAVTAAEKRFSPLLFQHFSDRVVKSAKFSLVKNIADRYAGGAPKESTDVRA